jgi:hypothetical protein
MESANTPAKPGSSFRAVEYIVPSSPAAGFLSGGHFFSAAQVTSALQRIHCRGRQFALQYNRFV